MTPKQEEHRQQGLPPTRPGSQGFTGTLNLELPDLLQMLCLSRSNKTISVVSSCGEGLIWIKSGQICHAQVGEIDGEPAFFEIIQWKDGCFDIGPLQFAERDSIVKGWEHLLIEGIRQGDEALITEYPPVSNGEAAGLNGGVGEEQLTQLFDFFDKLAPEEHGQEAPAPLSTPVAETRKVRVLIVEDSSFFWRQLERMLSQDPEIEVAGRAQNGRECLEFLEAHGPVDLLTLDMQMPVMQGDTTLKHVMIRHSIPTLIISSFAKGATGDVFEFLKLGAVDFTPKPSARDDIESYGGRLRDLVKRAAGGDVTHYRRWRKSGQISGNPVEPRGEGGRILVVIGAEGAWMDWFRLPLRQIAPNNLVVGFQRMAPGFLPTFCHMIEEQTALRAKELSSAEAVLYGALHLGTGEDILPVKFLPEIPSIETGSDPGDRTWEEKIGGCLIEISRQAGPWLNIFCLSAARSLSHETVQELLRNGARVIAPPLETVICANLVESVRQAAEYRQEAITWAAPENLMEVW
jgi:two-component system, chemotaxis family, protein-glutamate methylesterase/glutaminase